MTPTAAVVCSEPAGVETTAAMIPFERVSLAIISAMVVGGMALSVLFRASEPPPLPNGADAVAPAAEVVSGAARSARAPLLEGQADADLLAVREGAAVPRPSAEHADLTVAEALATSDRALMHLVLPLVLVANEAVQADRRRLWSLKTRAAVAEPVAAADALWLAGLADRHRAASASVEALLQRVDEVPPSLVLAVLLDLRARTPQRRSASEGRPAIAVSGSAATPLAIGVTDSDRTLSVAERGAEPVAVLIRDIIMRLNSAESTASFREQRAAMRRTSQPLDGTALALSVVQDTRFGLPGGSQLAERVRHAQLLGFDRARLEARPPTAATSLSSQALGRIWQ